MFLFTLELSTIAMSLVTNYVHNLTQIMRTWIYASFQEGLDIRVVTAQLSE
jgi:hypothetical protein